MILKANLQFRKHQAIEMALHVSATHPTTPVAGQIYYGSADITGPPAYNLKHIRYYDGTDWQELATRAYVDAQIIANPGYAGWLINALDSATGAYTVASSNKIAFIGGTDITTALSGPGTWHTRAITINHATYGTPTATSTDSSSHISDITVSNGHVTAINTVARSVRWDSSTTVTNNIPYWAGPTGILNRTGYTVKTVIAEPGIDTALATEKAIVDYVKLHVHGLKGKASVRAASVANINLSNPGTAIFDGVTLSTGQRILVKDQSTASQNGIYIFATSSTAMTRALDADTWDELVSAYVFVDQGTVNSDTGFLCTVDIGGTLGTTAVTWVKFFNIVDHSASNVGSQVEAYVSASTRPFQFRTFNVSNAAGTALSIALGGTDNLNIVHTFTPANVNLDEFGSYLGSTKGGTGQTTWVTGQILYSSNGNTLSRRNIGSTNDILCVVSGVPNWVARDTIGSNAGWLTGGSSDLANISVSTQTLNINAFTARTNDRFYRHTDNPNAANTGIKYGGNLSVYAMNVYNNLAVTGTSTLTGKVSFGTIDAIGVIGTPATWNLLLVNYSGGGPWEMRRISVADLIQGGSASEHYVATISGTSDSVLASVHGCGTNPVVLLREKSGTNWLDVYGDIYVNADGDVTWSVAEAMPADSKIIIIGAKTVRS